MSRYSQYSPILRRSKKLSCKKGGVDCKSLRRERDLSNTLTPTTSTTSSDSANLPLNRNGGEKIQKKKDFTPILQIILSMLIDPYPPIIFLQPHSTNEHDHVSVPNHNTLLQSRLIPQDTRNNPAPPITGKAGHDSTSNDGTHLVGPSGKSKGSEPVGCQGNSRNWMQR